MFRTTGNKQYLKDGYGTLRALVRYFKHGFYCINIPTYGYTLLKENGFTAEADTLLNDFKSMADVFCENGPNYPTSEVNYEQSIVAPSIIHLLNVYMLTGDEKYLKGAESQLPLLESLAENSPVSTFMTSLFVTGMVIGLEKTGFGEIPSHITGALYRVLPSVFMPKRPENKNIQNGP